MYEEEVLGKASFIYETHYNIYSLTWFGLVLKSHLRIEAFSQSDTFETVTLCLVDRTGHPHE